MAKRQKPKKVKSKKPIESNQICLVNLKCGFTFLPPQHCKTQFLTPIPCLCCCGMLQEECTFKKTGNCK